MTTFVSYAAAMADILTKVVSHSEMHAKWLNTLSYLENCGARKIAACEHPTLVKEDMLKHAAEEFRHAHHLKRQIEKISPNSLDTYTASHILGGRASLHYLSILDLKASRYLKSAGLNNAAIKEAAYVLVTYAIELRADELYRIYDEVLRQSGSKVAVKSILLEEKEHLNEMIEGLQKLPKGPFYADQICAMEAILCNEWIFSINRSIRGCSNL